MMTCGAARRMAWPDGAPRVMDERVEAAEAHIAQCEACRRFVADMRTLAERIAASAPQPVAPPDVRERLFASLARERTEDARRRVRRATSLRLAAAAAIVLAVASGLWRLSPVRSGPSDDALRLVDDHRQALHREGIASDDTAIVARWLSSRVPFAVHVPTFTNGQLVGARVAEVKGRRGVVMLCRIDVQDVSYYVLPSSVPPGVNQRMAKPDVQVSSWAGFRVATWHEPGLSHALVAELAAVRLAGLARECIRQMLATVVLPQPLSRVG